MAGRIRSFKPEILDTDRDIAALTDAAFRLYAVIVLQADDAGRVRVNAEQFAGAGWWARPAKERPSGPEVAELLEQLRAANILRVYDVAGVEYGEIIGWNDKGGTRYQAISKNQGARHPAPPSSQGALPFPDDSRNGSRSDTGNSSGNGSRSIPGTTPGENVASVPRHSEETIPGTTPGTVPVPIRSDPIRSEPIQTPAPARTISVLVAPRAEDIPVDDRGHVTREAIREEAARAVATLRGRSPL